MNKRKREKDCDPALNTSSDHEDVLPASHKPSTAKEFLKHSIQIENETGKPSVHKLQLQTKKLDSYGILQKHTFGKINTTFSDKVIMFVGATGSGKTTLINGMVNYILGVKWEDDFRFKLIDEETHRSQAESQTSSIASYNLIHQEGFQVPYSLTLIDTPGFGDTKGIDRDRILIEQIRECFSTPEGVDHIDAVCFLAQSSLARLTQSQRYVFDSILSLFGKDIADNILLMVTFADGHKPPVLEAIKVAEVPCPMDNGNPVNFKFNNSAWYTSNGVKGPIGSTEEDENFDRLFWKMGVNSLKKFFVTLTNLETKSLCLTKTVLDERKQLETIVEGLQPHIGAGLTKQEEIRKTTAVLEQNWDKMKANENFEYEVPKTVARKEVVSHFITNCQKCHQTCHYPCGVAGDRRKNKCSAMDKLGNCRVCPGKCLWSVHFNQNYRWIHEIEIEKGTYHELKKNYESALGESLTAAEIFLQLNKELSSVEAEVVDLIEEMSESIQRLEEIALKPNPLSTPDYIDLLIISEREEAKPGFLERIQSLMKVRERAVLIAKVSSRDKLMANTLLLSHAEKVENRCFYSCFDFRSWIVHK
ncbi:uncharacterized protein [Ambystoma mexicanum]|uniref:uncharacterized protein n=1 Tax=Ambystoma mexicanum TaxID=8296 RepID=UPI0037E952F1